MKSILPTLLLLCLATAITAQSPNNTLRGKVLYQSSGSKPAVGVRIAEPDATAVFSLDNGDYSLVFQNKRNGASLALEIGKDDGKSQKLELVNEKEIKAAKLPASREEALDIIVCPAGQRDIAAQKYYRILRTTADRELERKKKEVESLLAQKEKDFQKISYLIEQVNRMQAELDSAKIREQAFSIASINLDRASQLVKDAVHKIEEENDVEGALRILSWSALDSAYQIARDLKQKAEEQMRQVIEGYEFKISLLEPQFRHEEILDSYENIIGICVEENLDSLLLARLLSRAGYYSRFVEGVEIDYVEMALGIQERHLDTNSLDLAYSYNAMAFYYLYRFDTDRAFSFIEKAIRIREQNLPAFHSELAESYQIYGSILSISDRLEEAIEYLEKSVSIQEESHPMNAFTLGSNYFTLSALYETKGDFNKSEENEDKAISTMPDNSLFIMALNGLYVDKMTLLSENSNVSFRGITVSKEFIKRRIQKILKKSVRIEKEDEYFLYMYKFFTDRYVQEEKIELEMKRGDIALDWIGLDSIALSLFKVVLHQNDKNIAYIYRSIGLSYLSLNQFEEAKLAFEKSQEIDKTAILYYGWAAYHAMREEKEEAITNLQTAVSLGFNNKKWLTADPKMKNIWKDKKFKRIIKQLKNKSFDDE